MTIDMEQCSNSTPDIDQQLSIDENIDSKLECSSENVENITLNQTNSKPIKLKRSSIWEAEIIHKDVGSVFCKSYLISRHQMKKLNEDSNYELSSDIPNEKLREIINLSANLESKITITGRVKLPIVEEYFQKLRKHSNKEFLVLRLHPTTVESRKTYLKMFEFFHERERCGVIEQKKLGLKDVFIYPLSAKSEIPPFILPFDGNGLEKRRPPILLMFIVRSPLDDTIYAPVSPKFSDKKIIENIDNKSENENQTPINLSGLFCPNQMINPDDKFKKFQTEKILESLEHDKNSTLEDKVVALLLSHISRNELNSEPNFHNQSTNVASLSTPESNDQKKFNPSSLKSKTDAGSQKPAECVKHKQPSIWEGELIHKEIGSMLCKSFLVSRHQSGKCKEELNFDSLINIDKEVLRKEINLSVSLSDKIEINGSTKMLIVHDYLEKIRKHSNKEFLIFRLHPVNLQEGRQSYVELFDFLYRKNRCGVLDKKKLGLKDFFLYPLNAHAKIPSFFLPFEGFGFEKRRPHMLLMLIVRYPLEDRIYKSLSPNYDEFTDFSDYRSNILETNCHLTTNPTILPSENIIISTDNIFNKPRLAEKIVIMEKEDNASNHNEDIPIKSAQKTFDNDNSSPWNLSKGSDLSEEEEEDLDQGHIDNDLDQDSERCCIIDFDPIFNPMKLDDNMIPFLSYPELITQPELSETESQLNTLGDTTSSPNNSVAHKRHSPPASNSPFEVDSCDPKRVKYSKSDAN